ncbi:MAG: TonB-dependent receptor [Bacteroidales bacterium]|jgi:TonB-linked SusC/RagA family outer membrane protein|nr:TonB-dependent receptor [Bacteroidales bacterium]
MKKTLYLHKLVIAGLLILLSGFQLVAQSQISGTVTASDNKETLPGVNIVVKGTTRGTITDIYGNYILDLLPGDEVLQYSFTGYETFETAIAGRSKIDVELKAISELLDEIVVIGYGTVRKSDLTGAVSSIKADEISKTTSVNPQQALQGKVAGVHVTSNSGAPGDGVVVRVRGVGTFNNSAPIYVVDGMILDDISFLNSADILSMEVLKDASATAIYGSRGANGVILVQTKTAEKGQTRTIINFNAEYGIQHLAKSIDLLDGRQFAIISNEIRPGSYNNVDAVPNTDWQDLIFQTAPMQNYQLSISGATPKAEYYIGMGFMNQDGIVPKSSYQRISLKLNNTYHINDKVKIGNNFTITPFKQRNAPNVTYQAYRAQPLLEPYYADGSFGVVYNVGNPLADLAYSNDYRSGVRGVGNLFVEATVFNDFILKSSYGVDASFQKGKSFTPAYTIYNPDGTASQQNNLFSDLAKNSSDNFSWLWENTINYNKVIQKHNINAVAGFTMQKIRSEYFGMAGQNLIRDAEDFWYIQPSYIVDETNNINMLQNIYNGVDAGQYYSMMSFLFRTNYTYDNRYIATVTFRRDGSSKFREENRYSNFPSFALGWNVINESFMSDVDFLTNLKLRASWGKIGNDKISYFDQFSIVQSGLFAIFGNPDAPFPAATYSKSGNPNLVWETTTQTDIGLELGFFNNKLTAEFDYYGRQTDDILIDLSTPGHLGNGQGQKVRYNAASVLNRGFEFNLRWRETLGDFSYSIGVLGTTIHNEVLSIGGNSGIDSVLIGGYLGNGLPVTLSSVGNPIGAFYGYVTDGIFQSQAELDAYPHSSQAGVGDLRFVDVNGDGKLDGQDRTYIGSPIPDFIFGFNMDFGYKSFDLSVDIQGQTGNKIFNGKDVVRPDPYNFEEYVWDRWTGPGTSNTEPKASFGGYNYTPSDKFVLDGSFIRLRNVIFGYSLPTHLVNKLNLQKMRVYVKATNVFTLTKYSGYSPEIGGNDVVSNGIDYGIYPISAVYSFGINVTF